LCSAKLSFGFEGALASEGTNHVCSRSSSSPGSFVFLDGHSGRCNEDRARNCWSFVFHHGSFTTSFRFNSSGGSVRFRPVASLPCFYQGLCVSLDSSFTALVASMKVTLHFVFSSSKFFLVTWICGAFRTSSQVALVSSILPDDDAYMGVRNWPVMVKLKFVVSVGWVCRCCCRWGRGVSSGGRGESWR